MSRVYEINNLQCERRNFRTLIPKTVFSVTLCDMGLIYLWTKPSRVNATHVLNTINNYLNSGLLSFRHLEMF